MLFCCEIRFVANCACLFIVWYFLSRILLEIFVWDFLSWFAQFWKTTFHCEKLKIQCFCFTKRQKNAKHIGWKKSCQLCEPGCYNNVILSSYPTSNGEQTKRTPKRVLKKASVKVVFSSCFWFSWSWRLADSRCSERTPGTSLDVSIPDFMHLIKVLKIFSLLVVFYYQASRPPSHHPLVETWGNQLNFSLCFRPFSVLLKWDNF